MGVNLPREEVIASVEAVFESRSKKSNGTLTAMEIENIQVQAPSRMLSVVDALGSECRSVQPIIQGCIRRYINDCAESFRQHKERVRKYQPEQLQHVEVEHALLLFWRIRERSDTTLNGLTERIYHVVTVSIKTLIE